MGKSINSTLLEAYELMCISKEMTDCFEKNKEITQTYVHATSRGHEAIQLACAMQLENTDFLYPYYRDDAMLLGIGMKPYELMLQLLAKKDDPFSGGRTYYSHASLRESGKPKIPHQSSATGMQAIPASGAAMGIQYREKMEITEGWGVSKPISLCSIGDAAMTEGEVSEALQMAALKQYPLLVLVQDNDWDISANAKEVRSGDAAEYARGFPGINVVQLDGSDFASCYHGVREVLKDMRKSRKPYLIHAKVPLLNHHTSGVRMEWYRDDLNSHKKRDPLPKLNLFLKEQGTSEEDLKKIENKAKKIVLADFNKALEGEDPKPDDLFTHRYAPTPVTKESGVRVPKNRDETVMVDSALFAMREILQSHPEALFYGQDVGARLGGVFREAATLAEQFGDHRVFNTPIQEAFIIGSTVGMSAVGLKPIVEVQFSDYIWPGLNQLFTELSRSYYLSNGKWPASAIIRVPTGAYGSGGPYHSSSVESVLTNIKGIKIAYPSTGADLKGLMKSAFEDPNPVVILEHKGLYWSKIKGTLGAKTVEPSKDYIIPFGKGRVVLKPSAKKGKTACIITYGMGIYWSLEAEKAFSGKIEIIDLRTLQPWDKDLVMKTVSKHGRALVLTEEPSSNTFANAVSGEIQRQCFEKLDAPILVLGAEETPAIPLNKILEATFLPNSDKVIKSLEFLLNY